MGTLARAPFLQAALHMQALAIGHWAGLRQHKVLILVDPGRLLTATWHTGTLGAQPCPQDP